MRLIFMPVLLAALFLAPQIQANATTFTMPLIGEVEIVGDLPAAAPISISMSTKSLGASYWVVNTSIVQAENNDGPFSAPQGCVGTTCGTLSGFFVCGGMIGCGISLMPGTVISRTGEAVSFDVSDTSRFLTIDTAVMVNGPLDLELTANLPDGLQLLVISDPIPEGLAQTPLPGGLPLFASGLGVLALLSWRRKRRVAF
jgi:hypothetical protein